MILFFLSFFFRLLPNLLLRLILSLKGLRLFLRHILSSVDPPPRLTAFLPCHAISFRCSVFSGGGAKDVPLGLLIEALP